MYKAKIPIMSNPDALPYTDPEDIRRSLTSNLWNTALFYPCVLKTVDEGCRTFVEGNEVKTVVKIVSGIMKYKKMLDETICE